MKILTVNQGYPEWVGQRFIQNLKETGSTAEVIWWSGFRPEVICSERMYAWKSFVDTLPTDEIIMLSDLRDVVFQANPDELYPEKLWVFLESDTHRIVDEDYNRSWILQGWGETGLERIGNRRISCAGVTIGKQPDMAKYLKRMCEHLNGLLYSGADQGVHNWMIWNNEIDCKIWDNDGPVYTVGLEPKLDVRYHKIYNRNGELPYIVHQYDRHLTIL